MTTGGGFDLDLEEVVREFLLESRENLEQFEHFLLEAERDPRDRALLASMFRCIHSMKGSCGFLGFPTLEGLLHAGENLLGSVRDGRVALDEEVATSLLRLVDAVRRLLADIEETGREGEHELAETLRLLERATAATEREPLPEGGVAPEIEVDARAVIGPKVRVDVSLLDRLMNLVGELVLARNQVLQQSTQGASVTAAGPVQQLRLVTTELQDAVIKTRMQPIGNVWSRFPRMVRDLARASGKQVRLELDGRETELDRSIIEAIFDPLTHLVRNAVDHGIEPPARRLELGKPAEGSLVLRSFHEGGMVTIEAIDDGAGIPLDFVKRRAVQLNLVSADRVAQMADREVLQLLFLPGFTTSERVTMVSGRGVGMDVVRTNIEKLGGTVELQTRLGAGTSVKIKIPLTLAIVPALIVECEGQRFAIPQASLLEVVRLDEADGTRMLERMQGATVLRLRDELLPVMHLGRELYGEQSTREHHSPIVVVLQADQRMFGVAVDEIHDTEEIVVKPLWKRLKGLSVYAGATVMGDGAVALILDAMALAQRLGMAFEAESHDEALAEPSGAEGAADEELVLLCRIGSDGRLAIPLGEVARLEDVPRARVENVGGAEHLQYRGEILRLVRPSQVLEERRKRPRESTGDAESHADDNLQVVVLAHERGRVGLVVDGIMDITSVQVALDQTSRRRGVLGTMVVEDRITEFLDVSHMTRALESRRGAEPREAVIE
jgi:two-component system, chemotaxis family, sensor kinase CheA